MYHYKMSIEDRLKSHGEKKKEYEFIYNVWKILKEEIGKRLEDANRIFITYSSHDRTHSDSIILSIERLLGEERIEMLSPTDCFALLMVSYIHDIGMALNPEDVYRALNSQEFKDYILGYRPYYKNDEARKYIKSVEKIIKNQELENSSSDSLMGDLYYGILLSLQEIFRKDHHLGVEKIGDSIQIFSNYKVKSRIIKHIIKIAKFHGENRENIFKLEPVVNGWTDDEFHPRFLAILLRMGDLFDLNFSRFNDWMKEEIYNKKKNSLCIPYLSRLHLYKDESIVSMFITPKKIKIFSEIVQEDYYLGLEIAQIVSDWFQYIEEEFDFIKQNWMELTEGDFGAGLGKLELYITLNGNRFNGKNKKVSMSYSLNFMNKLTEGTNLYFNKYSFLRELLQNSIDASLLKLWHDIEERFFFYKEKEEISDQLVKYIENKNNENSKNLFFDDINYKIFQNYPITVFLVDDKITNQAFLVFHDYGIGLHEDDIPYLSTIGCNSKEKNRRTKELMQAIPDIFKPAGYFGIGLHSAFSATDQLQFFSFSGNPIHIIIEDDKYNKTGRKIQWLEMVDNNLRSQFLNHEYGTYTAMKIDCDYFYTGKSDKDSVKMVALEEMESAILNLKNDNYEYFNIKYKRLERYDDNGSNAIKKIKEKTLKNSFFAKKDLDIERFKLDIKEESYGYSFQYPNLSIWDKNKKILITFEIALPVIIDNDLFYYESVRQDVLKVYYRFSRIQSLDALFVNQERNSLISNIFSGIKIRIFDHNVNDYLTIDRDRLKVNALDEQYILNLRNKLLNEYYEYLINNKKKILRDLDHKRDIARLLGMAFSLLKVKNAKEIYELLTPFFYSRIRNELIPIKEYILNMRLVDLKNMRLKSPTLKTIFTENYKFNYELPIKKYKLKDFLYNHVTGSKAKNIDQIINTVIPGYVNVPFDLFQVESIKTYYEKIDDVHYEMRVFYTFSVKNEVNPLGIIMDRYAELYDYYPAVVGNLNFIDKIVFKPNRRYSLIIVPDCPSGYKYGENWNSKLDSEIHGVILSPFGSGSIFIFAQMKEIIKICISDLREDNNLKHFLEAFRFILRELILKEVYSFDERKINKKYDLDLWSRILRRLKYLNDDIQNIEKVHTILRKTVQSIDEKKEEDIDNLNFCISYILKSSDESAEMIYYGYKMFIDSFIDNFIYANLLYYFSLSNACPLDDEYVLENADE